MPISSANPDTLDHFVRTTRWPRDATRDSVSAANWLAARVMIGCVGRGVSVTNLPAALDLLDNMAANEEFVRGVANALRAADSRAIDATVSVADADLAARLASGDYDIDVHDVTLRAAELLGLPTNSGFVDDPICAANGNFIHTDTDLAFGGTSSSLDLLRHYNSVAAERIGVFGAGWTSTLDVRLTGLGTDAVRAHLADGAVVTFERRAEPATWMTSGRRHLSLADIADGWELVVGADRSRSFAFDEAGRLVGWRVGPSHVTVMRDDDRQRITSVCEQRSGRTISFDWGGGVIRRTTTSDGRYVDYEYGTADTLTRAESRSGWFDYAYDDGRMTTATDPDGITQFVNLYDEHGRVVEQTSPFGRITTYRYEISGATVITDQDGVRQAMIHDSRGNLTAVIDADGSAMRLEYDDADRMVRVIDRSGAQWRYVFDGENGELIRRIDPDGLSESWTWDAFGRKLTDTDRAGNTVSFHYEGLHRSPSKVIGPDGSAAVAELDEFGLPTRVTDPDGVVTEFVWDDDGQLVTATDALGHRTVFDFDEVGLLARLVDPVGTATERSYDEGGRLIEQRRADAVTTFRRTAAGRPIGGEEPGGVSWSATLGLHGAVATLSDALGGTAHYRHDTNGNVTEVVAADGAVYRQEFDEVGRLIAAIDPAGAVARRRYDAAGRLVECTDGEGRTMQRTVDAWGRTLTSTAPDGGVTRWTYHPTGEIATVTGPDGRSWRTEVDAFGRTVALIDPAGGRASREFSAGGRLVARRSPMGRTERFEYDAAGRCVAVVGDGGTRRDGALDPAGRPMRVTVTDPFVGAPLETSFDWDAHGFLIGESGPLGQRSIERDAAGRVLTETDATGVARHFEYDARGLLTSATDPAGAVARYDYDVRGRLAAQTMPGDRTTSWTYDPTGHLSRMVDPAGVVTGWDRDLTGLATAVRQGDTGWARELDAAGREVGRSTLDGTPLHRFEYDAAGRMTSAAALTGTDGIASRTEFLWDDTDRITEIAGVTGTSRVERDRDGWATVLIDQFGQRTEIERDGSGQIVLLTAGDVDHTDGVDPASRRDLAGRLLIGRDGTLFTYDQAGRLTERATPDGASTRFEYRPDGLLSVERGPTGTRRFTYDRAGRVAQITLVGVGTTTIEYDAAGRRSVEIHPDGSQVVFGWDAGGRLVSVAHVDLGGDERRVHIDLDGVGRPVGLRGDVPSANESWSGLRLLGARVFDPSTHQFLSADPLLTVPASNGAASSYTYVWQDPVNFVDPTGLRPISIEEYQAIRQREEQGCLGQAWEAIKDDPWGTLAVAGLVTAAIVIGGPVGAGIALGMVATAGVGLATGTFSPTQVAIGGVVGGVSAGVGSITSSTTAMMSVGGVAGAGSDLATQALSGQPIDLTSVMVSGGVGWVTAGVGGTSSSTTSTAFRSAVSGGLTDASADVTYQVLTGDHTVDWNSVWISAATGATTSAVTHHLTRPSLELLAPSDIRLSQASINGPRTSVLTDSMRTDGWNGPPVDVVRLADGGLTTFDNKRVVAASDADVLVHAVVHDANDPFPSDRLPGRAFVPPTWGEAIEDRIAGQKRAWRELYPQGGRVTARNGDVR